MGNFENYSKADVARISCSLSFQKTHQWKIAQAFCDFRILPCEKMAEINHGVCRLIDWFCDKDLWFLPRFSQLIVLVYFQQHVVAMDMNLAHFFPRWWKADHAQVAPIVCTWKETCFAALRTGLINDLVVVVPTGRKINATVRCSEKQRSSCHPGQFDDRY